MNTGLGPKKVFIVPQRLLAGSSARHDSCLVEDPELRRKFGQASLQRVKDRFV